MSRAVADDRSIRAKAKDDGVKVIRARGAASEREPREEWLATAWDSRRVAARWPEDRSVRHPSMSKGGGGRGIRTPGTLPGSVVFKTTAIDHSAIPPRRNLA